jgi:hypothetical protein
MPYRELPLGSVNATLSIDGESYDIDYFGMDDGQSEDDTDALRFLFQLGRGYMIHLYVVQAGSRARPAGFFHTTWLKDCAVAEVEEEDTGAPTSVECEALALPLCHSRVAIADRSHAILTQTFHASAGELSMTFALEGGAQLVWTRTRRWEWAPIGEPRRAILPEEWPRFS